jgi:ATP-dependent helicase/nuclease subunit B
LSARLALRPSLATIAPNIAFLDALATWWLGRAGDDPVAVADGIFLVPTRRAARGLAEAFLRASGGRPLLLPRILALGALDETPLALDGALSIPPAVPGAQRLAVLTRFILAMNGANGAPTEADRAWVLAEELANLLDEAARAEINLAEALPNAVAEDFAANWQVTLQFLAIVTAAWPAWLADNGLFDVATRQSALLGVQESVWRAHPPPFPVIAAGTTGAIPAVGRLLRLVAHLPGGLVVLPGLDRALDEASWDALEDSHPQASLRALLAMLQARREDVRDWAEIAGTPPTATCPSGRIDLWRTALLPAASLSAWQSAPWLDTAGLQRLEPADQQEEAQAIALTLREALQEPRARAALVTPDRQLARRVAAELLRFGIVADDSAGEPLAEIPAAVFLRLLAEAVAENLRPVPLLSLLKHPLTAAGLSPAACRQEARRLERRCLRGPRPGPGIEGLRARNAGEAFLDRLAAALHPLLSLATQPDASPDQALVALLEAAERLATTNEAPGATRLWAGEDGEALAQHLAALREALPILPPQPLRSLPYLLDATLAGAAVRSRRSLRGREGTEHPRIQIWGLLEARLQTADVIVLGGLTEGVWPQAADSGPWMNRAMRRAVGLPSPEERLGLSAHDFVMAGCAAPRVILSAPRRRDSAPAVPARWLIRLEALLEGRTRLARHPAAAWVRALDRPAGAPVPVSPPAPCPAVALRPRKLSVTEIETWLRDPYGIYAKHVLKLRALDPLEQSADAADYGKIVHAGLNRFFADTGLAWPVDAEARLIAAMDAALDAEEMRPALAAWWRPRLRRIAIWVADAERDRRAAYRLATLRPEIPGVWVFPAPAGPFTLHGRADRIERRADGSIAILDYKTGTPPTARQVEEGRSPQLPLEAVMAEAGAFGEDLTGPPAELVYWRISGGAEPGKVLNLFASRPDKIPEIARVARESLMELVASFDQPTRAYLSQPSPGAAPRFTDYARLARVAEWAAAGDEEVRSTP